MNFPPSSSAPSPLLAAADLLADVLDADPAQRTALLAAADPALKAQVENLLGVAQAGSSFLEHVHWPIGESIADAPAQIAPGTRIGAFTVSSLLARGGMGVVYRARQDEPARDVALKVLGTPFPSRESLRRFRQESQVLALLQHPGIAPVIQAGAFDGPTGSVPFFAMELVEGQSLIGHADTVPLIGRLTLLANIADALQHAHTKGVIHRDLKPANIIVDAAGRPRILDFGIARLTDSDLRATHAPDAAIGTLAYMSPEQFGSEAGNPARIDTRSDLYSLGVVAYRVLTGRLPYEREPASILDAATIITSTPVRPSRANAAIRGDLEAVLLKSLEHDPGRRYQAADAFAADLRAVIRGQPVSARRPTAAYQLRCFARRNKALVGAVAVAIVTLIAGAGVATWQAIVATRARDQTSRHIQQLQRTARTLLNEVYSAVAELPGSARARVSLVQQAATVLEELQASTPDDPAAQVDLAESWFKLASAWGAPGNDNLHNRDMGLQCSGHAIDVARRTVAAHPMYVPAVDILSKCLHSRAGMQRTAAEQMRDVDDSIAATEFLWTNRDRLSRADRVRLAIRRARAFMIHAAYASNPGDAGTSIEILKDAARDSDNASFVMAPLGLAYRYLAGACKKTDPDQAADAARAAIAVLRTHPEDPDVAGTRRLHEPSLLILLGELASSKGWDQEAIAGAKRGLADMEAQLAADPGNDFLCNVIINASSDYTGMWLALASNTALTNSQRTQAATEGAAAIRRFQEVMTRLKSHDQIGPVSQPDDPMYLEPAARFQSILRALEGSPQPPS